jgi:pimeloyl-ACP methyl ester carboxylesterase
MSPPGGPFVTIKTLVRPPQFKPLVILPGVPRAVIILLPGADGWLDIDIADPANAVPRRLQGNFLVRTREGLSGQAFLTVLVDAPSDRQDTTGMSGGFRTSDEHARDLTAIISHFKPKLIAGSVMIGGVSYGADAINSPVVIVGSSAGTTSAVLAAIRPLPLPSPLPFPGGNPDVGGVVLTSAVTTGPTSIGSLPFTTINRPVLFVHHVNDGCMYSKYRNATDAAFNMMKASVRVSFAEITGTPVGPIDPADPDPPLNPDPCGAPGTTGYLLHGFNGAGTAALDSIQRWIGVILKQ